MKFEELKQQEGLNLGRLDTERYREYDFGGRIYRIDNPIGVYFRSGGTTHRVVGSDGIVHCVPAPGYMGCVLRWLGKNDENVSW